MNILHIYEYLHTYIYESTIEKRGHLLEREPGAVYSRVGSEERESEGKKDYKLIIFKATIMTKMAQ